GEARRFSTLIRTSNFELRTSFGTLNPDSFFFQGGGVEIMRPAQCRTLVIAAIVCLGLAGSAFAQCGPMDVVFVVDVTGSMGGAIDNVKKDLPGIITQIQTASGGDFRLGLVKFDNTVIVVNDM